MPQSRLLSLLFLLAPPAIFAQASAQTAPPAPETSARPAPLSLNELSSSLERLVNRIRPAVVQIFSTGYVTADDSDANNTASLLSKQRSTGSGIILS